MDIKNEIRKINGECDENGLYNEFKGDMANLVSEVEDRLEIKPSQSESASESEYEDEYGYEDDYGSFEDDFGAGKSDTNFNLTAANLKTAAQMFIYLNSCPGTLAKFDEFSKNKANEQWFKSWFKFYDDLLRFESPVQIVLTLNRLMKKHSTGNGKENIRNQNLFKKISTMLNLKYRDIQTILPGGLSNVSLIANNSDMILNASGRTFQCFNVMILRMNNTI